jgi:hypothetical protein
MNEEQTTRITLRLPQALHAQLAEEADDASRSLNGEIVSRLASTLTGAALAIPDSIRDEITARAQAASTTFELELIRAIVAGLSPGAPAVLVVEHRDNVPLRAAGALIDAALKQLPPDAVLRFTKLKK